MKTIWAVIPAYNEAESIGRTIRALQAIPSIDKIMVVNDGSTDATADEVRKTGVYLLDLPYNMGKGGAMNKAVGEVDADIVLFLDGDLGDSASQAELILKPVLEGQADLAIAAFPPPKRKGGFGLVKKTAAWAIQRAGNLQSKAPLSGQRAMTREVLEAVLPFDKSYGVELGMTIRALRKGFRVVEVPTEMSHKETGRDLQGFLHRGRQWWDVLKVVISEWRNLL
ncbi:MAG TPA: glycosyltransferase family 2 protein [Syntrophomonadaceae bacterium]|nr:glycosyltransferase family 2 protein [Syntrophomonadaceae bacterium]HQE23974.1 glycosyltransferase family 2 protein [Syntrophomonadaceae bacterium]